MVMNIADALAAYRQSAGNVIPGKGRRCRSRRKWLCRHAERFYGRSPDSMKEAEKSAALGTAGKANLQEVIIAVSSAELMMQTVVALRDKVISAYQEIIRMPV